MDIFFILYIVVAALAFLDMTTVKNKYIFVMFFGIFIIFLSGIRWETGTDWEPYYNYFIKNNYMNDFIQDEVHFEIGYAMLNFIAKEVFSSYSGLLFLIATIIVFLKYFTIYQYAAYPLVGLFINFINFNGDLFPVRQMIAVAICAFAVRYIIQRNQIYFILFVICAMSFHISAIIFLPAYYIFYLKIGNKKFVVLLLLSFVLGNTGGIDSLLNTLLLELSGLDLYSMVKLADYASFQYTKDMETLGGGGSLALVLGGLRRGLFVPILLYAREKMNIKYKYYSGLLNLYFISILVSFLFMGVLAPLIGRITIYYFCFEFLLIPSLFLYKNNWCYKILILLILLIYGVFKFYWGISMYYEAFVPFKTVF